MLRGQRVQIEAVERNGIFHCLTHGVDPVLPHEAVRILIFGESRDANGEAAVPQNLHAPHRAGPSGLVAVVGDDHFLDQPPEEVGLPLGERRAHAAHHVDQAGLVERQDIGVPLNKHGVAGVAHGIPRPMQSVQVSTLVE